MVNLFKKIKQLFGSLFVPKIKVVDTTHVDTTPVTKTYSTEKAEVLIDAKGKLTKTGKAYIKELKKSNEPKAYQEWVKNELKAYSKIRKEQGEELTAASFKSHLMVSRIERMLYNFDTSPEEIAAITGTDVSDVLNEANWDFTDKIYTDKWEFTYNYEEGFTFQPRKKQ